MSSLARRSLRTTVAVAGIAAAGVGFAAPAFAAPQPQPQPQDQSGTDDAAPATDAGASPNVVGDLPTPDTAELPQLFTIESTSVYTASQSPSELPTADDLPPAPSAQDLVNMGGHEQFEGVEIQTAGPQEQDGPTQGLDAGTMVGDLAAGALGTTSNNTIGD